MYANQMTELHEMIANTQQELLVLQDKVVKMQRRYEDLLYNIDEENLSTVLRKEKDDMKSEITVSAEGIKLLSSAVTENEEKIAQITVTAEEINSKVSSVQTDLEGAKAEFTSSIQQTANNITHAVQASYSKPLTVTSKNDMTDYSKLYYYQPENLYYFWNGNKWTGTTQANFGTVFEQTLTGFKFKGDVETLTNDSNRVTISESSIKLYPKNGANAKLSMGFNSKTADNQPVIVFGEGDGGNADIIEGFAIHRKQGYILKDSTGLNIVYRTPDRYLGMYFVHAGGGFSNDTIYFSSGATIDFSNVTTKGLSNVAQFG